MVQPTSVNGGHQVWEALRNDLPITDLYSPRNLVAMTARLNGFRPVPDGLIRVQGLEMSKGSLRARQGRMPAARHGGPDLVWQWLVIDFAPI